MRDDELGDDLIDRVAREMTQGEPPAQLRPAVRARIGQRSNARSMPMWIPVMAATVVLVISVIVARTWSGPHEAPLPSGRIANASRVTAPAALAPAPQLAAARPVQGPAPASRKRTPQRALVVDPLVIEPIRVPLIAIDASSGVMPIEIELLQIEPLQPQ